MIELLEERCLLAVAVYRTIDGTGNNLAHPEWGSTDEQLLRIAPAEYADGIAAPAGTGLPSARTISNALAAHADEDTPNDRNLTAYIYVWGQVLDHDHDLTKGVTPAESFNILVRDRGELGIPDALVELLNDAGEVVASTWTNFRGQYSFDDFGETGDFQVRVAVPSALAVTTANPQAFLVSTGDVTVRGVDFGVRLADRAAAGSFRQEYADILAALLGPDDAGEVLPLPHRHR